MHSVTAWVLFLMGRNCFDLRMSQLMNGVVELDPFISWRSNVKWNVVLYYSSRLQITIHQYKNLPE